MCKFSIVFLAFPLIALGAGPSFYGAAFSGPGGPATLYSVSAAGTATAIGPIGFNRVGAMDISSGGTLYGIGSNGSNTSVLITINTTTGAGTLVAPVAGGGWSTGSAAQDMSFRPSDGKLFAYQNGSIYTIDTSTGVATGVGFDGVGFLSGNAMAFSGSTLYYAASSNLFTLNQSTGAATSVVGLTFQPAFGVGPRSPAMKFDPTTNTLWAIVGTAGGGQTSLGTIDTTTGAVTFAGGTQAGMDALALQTPASPPPPTSSVPTMSWPVLGGLAVLLAGLGSLLAKQAQAL